MYGKPRKTKAQMVADVAADHPGAVIAYAHKDASKRNTLKYALRDGDFLIEFLRYQDTDIIRWNADGSIVLNSGGWRTVTTKSRFNEHLPLIQVWQTRGVWYVGTAAGTFEYYDGMVINPDGTVIDTGSVESDRVKDYTKRINRFALLITDDNLPVPNAGDCWYCSMIGGDDCEHLESHIDEGYVHGSLLVNAMRHVGYNDDQISVHYSMKLGDTFRRAVRKFLKSKFNIAA